MDPHSEEDDIDVFDMLDLQQSILLEVWDSDTFSRFGDYLGECWLPPLSSLGQRTLDLVLPLCAANFSEEAENGPSRQGGGTKITVDSDATEKDINKKITGNLHVSVSWKYPAEEPGQNANALDGDTHSRALIHEKLHTGKLTLKIKEATGLRRSDAAKKRDCDPLVEAWLRNDSLMRWRRKPIARTKSINNNRNPKWNFVKEDIQIMAGEFEAKLPMKDGSLFGEVVKMFHTKKYHQKKQAERDIQASKRFGNDGVRIFFSDQKKPGGQVYPGENHGIEILLGDSIFDFKKKLEMACAKESSFWKARSADGSSRAATYADITFSSKALVMVFVGSNKLQHLYQAGMQSSNEYQLAYEQAVADPCSWQPLDQARSFSQYPEFGFGKSQAQQLRVCEASDVYKMYNLRYKEFAREQNKQRYEDTDTQTEAYGWAKYVHKKDSDGTQQTTEWRPCMVSADASAGAVQSYNVSWCFPVAGTSASSKAVAAGEAKEIHKKQFVLLQPRCPLFDTYVHPAHAELLEQARNLRTSGKNDFDIAQILDKLLKEKLAKAPSSDERVPPITVDVVRSYLVRMEKEKAPKK
jgi:hypothetical protein